MKKILWMFVLMLCSCASEPVAVQTQPVAVQPQTQPTYSYNSTVRNTCNTCSTSYTVSKPVEVIYKNVTYTTVYEPKTYTSTSYEHRPYTGCEQEYCK